ncbi:hypothetical protein ACHAQA_004163 [Verticillium albo-atrum]
MVHNELNGEDIARALHGRTLHVPSMKAMFKHWPQTARNVHYPELVKFVDQLITQMLNIPGRVAQHKSQDLALFCAFWYPNVDWEKLKTLSYYTIWLFLWDDTIDTAEFDLADDLEEANRYRHETIVSFQQFIRSPASAPVSTVDSVNGAIKLFGRDVASFFTTEETERFLYEVNVFIRCSGQEQEHRISGTILGYDEYIDLRLGTTAVYTLTGLAEFIIGEHLPQHLMNSQARRDVWKETNIGIIIVNDILSLKKELRTMCLINAVSALMKEGMDLQSAVDELMERLAASIARLDQAAATLDRMTRHQPLINRTVRQYSDACRTMVTATYEFSLVSARYMLSEYVAKDGSVSIPL